VVNIVLIRLVRYKILGKGSSTAAIKYLIIVSRIEYEYIYI